MKKILVFLRSMKFGMILLTVIALLSVLGTVIPQGQETAVYEAAYGATAGVILFLGLDHLYATWYYIALFVLLCLNLLLCSVLRIGQVKRVRKVLLESARRADELEGFRSEHPEKILAKKGFRKAGDGEDGWIRNSAGFYGSFVTHLALLLMLMACACVFALEKKTDYPVPVGETVTLGDGTVIHVDDFSIGNEDGLDYTSRLTAVLPDQSVKEGTVRVNHPVRFGRYKVYQQSYGYLGQVDVRTSEDGEDERAPLDSAAFLSLDGENGIHYMGSFGTFIRTEDGDLLPEGYSDAEGEKVYGYMIALLENGQQQLQVAAVDETVEAGGVWCTFREPLAYPGLRVKTLPAFVMPMLYATFVLLVFGLYLCFFHVPATAVVRGNGIALRSLKEVEGLERMLLEEVR